MKPKIHLLFLLVFFLHTLPAQVTEVLPDSIEFKSFEDDQPPEIWDAPPEDYDQPEAPKDKVYDMFDIAIEPYFPGGETEMFKFIAANLQYPPLARENNICGVVALTFVVDTLGALNEVRLIKDIGAGCGKEAMRILSIMPKWVPGEANGHKVPVLYTLPMRFRLE